MFSSAFLFSNVIFGHFPKAQGRCVTQVYLLLRRKKKKRARVAETPKFVSFQLEDESDRAVVSVPEEGTKRNASVSCFRFRCNVAFDIYNFSCLHRKTSKGDEILNSFNKFTPTNRNVFVFFSTMKLTRFNDNLPFFFGKYRQLTNILGVFWFVFYVAA